MNAPMFSHRRPAWSVEGRDWPNREASRFVEAGGLSWHVQVAGDGPALLLLHGTGASTHSWRDLLPLLSHHFRVLAPDLPGHGFTGLPASRDMTLPGMARLVAALVETLGERPALAAGHSAGAAILMEMALSQRARPTAIVSLNGALLPIRGSHVFSPLAKLLFLNPLAPRLFAWRAEDDGATRRLIEGTGSHIDPRGLALYARLFRCPGHVAGTLGMMANWDLDALRTKLPRLAVPSVLVAAAGDRAVPPGDADRVAAIVPGSVVVHLPRGGHLVHEERPRIAAALIMRCARRHRIV
jgi:magnesium chelatase accessory protein